MNDRMMWYRLRRDMFEQLRAEVRDRLGPEDADIERSRKVLEEELRGRWRVGGLDEISRAWRKHPVVLLGDFHALRQSQKTHRRLLESLPDRYVLGLECLHAKHQKLLDAYMAGRLSEIKFLKQVGWRENWGFPWENYRLLLDWARSVEAPVVALNSAHRRLSRRDQTAARLVGRARTRWPDRRIVIVFGDLHLTSEGLPQALIDQGVVESFPLRIFQNVEEAYFRLLKKGLDHQVDVIRWDAKTFAVQSVPPWVKWQNFLLWLEQSLDVELDEESPDPTDTVARMVEWLSRELGLKVDPKGLTVFHAGEDRLWSKLGRSAGARTLPWIELLIQDGRSFYLSKAGWGFLARSSVNHAASLAMQYVHDRCSGGARLSFQFPGDFERMIWVEAVAYFGSKVINPRRKSETLVDLRTSLSSHQAGDHGREALRLALAQKMKEMMEVSGRIPNVKLPPVRKRASWIAAGHLLGAMLGERLYHGYQQRVLSRELMGQLLKKPVSHPRFPMVYREILEIMEAVPPPFRSKKDRL